MPFNDINDVAKALADIAQQAGLPTMELELEELAAVIWRAGDIYAETRAADRRSEQPESREPRATLMDDIERRFGELLKRIGVPERAHKSGRPQSMDRVRLDAAASMWLDQNDTPEKQAELERALADWCQVVGIEVGERTIRTVAAVAIREHEERRGRLSLAET
jgi:hypothetical protein